jgi:predicted ATPase
MMTALERLVDAGVRQTDVLAHGFVGRAREAALLRDAVHDVLAGRGRLVLLAGEPGIGKTRLAEETATYAQANGMRVLWGRCWEGGGAPAFWPWIQLIRGSLAPAGWPDRMLVAVKPGLACIARMVPELQSTLPVPTAVQEHAPALGDASRGPGAERFRLLDAITTLFKELAATTPLMMVLDDLHAADQDSLVLLRFLARELTQIRILVVGTYRDLEVRQSAQQAELLADIGREGSTIPLAGLTPDAVADFIRRIAKLPADDELVTRLHHVTSGNPFFLDEIVRLMIARQGRDERDGTVSDFVLPDSVRAVIRRRIAPFDGRTKSVLTTAAVIGNEFDLALLREVSGIPSAQLGDSLAAAAANAVIVEPADPSGAFRFSHAIVSEALRADLGALARVRLHQRITAALERLHAGDLAPHLAQLAHHSIEALSLGGADKAVEYSRRGAENARDQLAFAEAVRLYEMALRALAATTAPDEEQRCQLLLAMGEAQAQGGSLDEARQAFEEAADAARRIGRAPLLAECALRASAWFGTFFTVDRALMALVQEALTAVDQGDSVVRCSLLAVLASERYWSGERERGLALSADAVTMARRLGDSRSLVSALWVHSQIRWGPEDVEGRLAAATEIAALAESIGDHQRALRAHEMRFTALLEMGDMQGLQAEIRSYEQLAETAGEQFGIVERFHAALALLRGDFTQAQRQIQELRTHAQRRQDPALVACAQALSGGLWEEQGPLQPDQVELAANTLIS